MRRFSSAWAVPLVVALAAAASGLFFDSSGARLPDGTPTLALDDSYIHLQYAWQTAQGHFLQYSTGDRPTTGATSLLYMLLVAGGFALGVTHQAMPGVVIAAGGVLFVVSAALFSDLSRRLAAALPDENQTIPPWGAGLLVGLLYAGSGWMAWAYFSGMETGLLLLLTIGTLWALVARRTILTAVLAALAALTRPEALLLGVALLAADWLAPAPADPAFSRWRRVPWLLLPLAAAAAPFAVNAWLTGSLGSTGLQAKSLFTFVPFYPRQIFSIVAGNAFEIAVRLFGGPASDSHWHAFPLTQLLAAGGLWLLWQSGKPLARRVALVCLMWVVIGGAATATLQTALWHHFRYQMPFYPALLLSLGVSLPWLVDRAARLLGSHGVALMRGALALAVSIWCGYSLIDFRGLFGWDTATTASLQVVLAEWVRDNTPPDSLVAAHDVGAVGYIGERKLIDVVGLTTDGMAASFRNGPGSIYEALENARPDYYALYPRVAPPYFLEWNKDLEGQELFLVNLQGFSPYTSAIGTQVVTRPDWSGAALAETPHQPDIVGRLAGWELVDHLDVADVASEKDHGYRWWNSGEPPGYSSDVRRFHYRAVPTLVLADGGRLLTGGESFTLSTRPGQPLLLVSRLNQTADMVVDVQADGADMGLWRLPAIPGEWLESSFVIPAQQIKNGHTRLTLSIQQVFNGSPETRYSPFYYWAYQGGDLTVTQPAPGTPSKAVFGDAVRLVGFDLQKQSYAPGDVLALTLYWQAMSPPHADLRVFAHLVDPAQADVAAGIVAQADSAPSQGTHPFWVWGQGEVGVDTVTLAIPAGARPGTYLLLIGVYDAGTGQRLLITGETDFGSSRLLLGNITVH